MSEHVVTHRVAIGAEPEAVLRLVSEAQGWPHVLETPVHVDLLLKDDDEQLLRVWTVDDGRISDFTTRHRRYPDPPRIAFQRIVSQPPVAALAGEWTVTPDDSGGCVAVLTHRFEAIADDPAAVVRIEAAIERCARRELGALKRAAELGSARSALLLTFQDAEMIRGPASAVFDFFRRADLWPARMSHVRRAQLTEEPGGVQYLELETRDENGRVHTGASIRICFPDRLLIVAKQLRLPPIMAVHTGHWQFEEADGVVFGRCWQTVTLDPAGVRAVLGEQATLADAREEVRRALGADSVTTLRRAKEFLEAAGEPGGPR